MGIVYLAREVRLDRLVAIKLLPPHLAAQAPLRERFLREARMAARLSHPNVVPIYAVDEVEGHVFYAMAYVRGETLARRVETRGPLPPAEAARLLREVAWALAYAHAQGVVHRDVKPENILIEEGTGRALVADFGIARLAEASGGTGVGEVLGTPDYMSPEQAAGEAVDGRSDLYSLGVVAFYTLSGRVPFAAPTAAALLAKHLTEPAPRLASMARGAPPALCRAVDQCLAKSPAQRFATGEALAEALADALEGQRDVPVALRVFLRRITTEQPALVGLGLFLTVMVLPSLIAWVVTTRGSLAGVLTTLGFASALGVGYLAVTLHRLRRLLRLGYTGSDVENAVALELKRRREELEYEYGPVPVPYVNRGTTGGVVLVVAGVAVAGFGVEGIGELMVLAGGLITYLGVRRAVVRQALGEARRARFWGSGFVKWLFRLAGRGLDVVPRAAVKRPTELAIGSAADVLFAALPKEARRGLGDVPEVLRGLEQHAQRVRRRIEELDALLADAGKAPRAGLAAAERSALVADLRAAREAAQQRLSEVVAILETIRLDLVRLRAGAGTLAGVTADLTRACEIGEQTDRLLAARTEVEAALQG